MNQFEEKRVIGDIVYTPIRGDGEKVEITGPGNEELILYSAIGLRVLEAMTKNKSKEVIMVARNGRGYKIPALHAAVSGNRHLYASKLIVDEETATQLAAF